MATEESNISNAEEELLAIVERHDNLIRACSGGLISFEEFLAAYNNFYWFYALDGHESDEKELNLLKKHHRRIKPHAELSTEILSKLCSDADAVKDAYVEAGRFGSDEAMRRITNLSEKYFAV